MTSRMKEGKTTLIEDAEDSAGRRKVFWLIDGEWVHKGWLMPEISTPYFTTHRRSV